MENKSNRKNSIFKITKETAQTNPFSFGTASTPISNPFEKRDNNITGKRINSYDSIILDNNVSETNKDGVEYRLHEKELQLQDLDAKIEIADGYGTPNEALSLRAKKQRLLQEIETLKKQQKYGNRIIGQIPNGKNETHLPFFQKVIRFFSRYIVSKISTNGQSTLALEDSLKQLSEINNNINELLDMNIPYGEKVKNYEALTHYLNKANLIHANISKISK